uniref:NADH-ubiquinone oxidoreductase chain 4 n=1 Tax=Pachyneuron aphidis TaxID=909094 RepID=A0A6G6D9T7_9HYME|nr:NADH dehydrogenase subunit 4 [Pachyneuron aphidis]
MMKLLMMIIFLNFNIYFWSNKILLIMMSITLMMMTIIYFNLYNFSMNWSMIYSWLGLDLMNFILILLTMWIISMMFMSSLKINKKKMFTFILIMLLINLNLSFMSMNYFMFYLFFEISLIPTFILIMGWGYQPERINASMFMLLYTLFASLPLLIILFYLLNKLYSLNFLIIMNNYMKFLNYEILMFIYMTLAFLVKLPLFMFHNWLPKAHVEAPVSGSMILAGVMLKLGGYGLMRSFMMMLNYCKNYNYLIYSIALMSMIMLSLNCLRQIDLKSLVAYSSIIHMGMMLLGLLTMSYWGYIGGLFMMIAHGLCSSAMFMLVNLFYERSKSRNMFINKGLIIYLPSLTMWWFMFCICNMSAPISLNLLSEIMIINVLLNWSFNMLIILMLGIYISAMYSLYLFSYTIHGYYCSMLNKLHINNLNSYLILLLHWIPLNMILLKMDLMM